MSSIRKTKKILKNLGYKVIKTRGNGTFVVDTPGYGQRITILDQPQVDPNWAANMNHAGECQRRRAMDTSCHSNRYY